MTAVLPARVPAGAPGGGRFAPGACRHAYAVLDALAAAAAPDPEPAPVGTRVEVDAPRCVHGSFARWAVRNCCATLPAPAAASPAVGGDAVPCTGRREDGDRCTRRTTRRDRTGRAACHQHGGRATP